MRIAHVVETLQVGGAEQMVVALARLQRERGHEVAIACLFGEGPLAARAREAGIELTDCGKRAGLDLAAAMRLRRWLRKRRPEVLHTHNPVPHYYSAAAAAGLGISTLLNTRHGMGASGQTDRRERLYRWAMGVSDFGVAVCRAACERFVAQEVIPAGKAVTVPNGIDLARTKLRSTEARAHLLRSLGVNGNPFVFGSVGRLNALKDQLTMLRAFARLLRADASVGDPAGPGGGTVLVIAGEGEERPALEREIAALTLHGHVFLLGQRDDVPELLAGMDAFVLSSRTEGYSLALVEAAAAGLPIVATDVGGNAEIVQEGVTGRLVPPGDPQALAQAMSELASSEATLARMGAAAREWAMEHGSLETMYSEYLRLYRGGHTVAAAVTERELHA